MALVSIVDLLRYKKEVTLLDPRTREPIGQKLWVRIMGDEDIKEAFKYARLKSSEMRKKLKDHNSIEYKLQVEDLEEQDDKDLYDLIVASRVNNYTRESIAVIVREELPKIAEVAVEPDAPSLSELEKFDEAEESVEDHYMKAIEKYVNERREVLEAELKGASHDKLVELASVEMQDLYPQQAFTQALDDQKGFRGTYTDEKCKVRAFTDLDEYGNMHSAIKSQLVAAYDELELTSDQVKK